MRVRGSCIAALCVLAYASAAALASAVEWPEHGVVRVGVAKSPKVINLDIPNCVSVSVDWSGNRVTAKGMGDSKEEASMKTGSKMLPGGGKLVGLMMLEDKRLHVVINTEMEGGGIESQTIRLPVATCSLGKMTVSSPNGGMGKADVQVSVSKEIQDLLAKA